MRQGFGNPGCLGSLGAAPLQLHDVALTPWPYAQARHHLAQRQALIGRVGHQTLQNLQRAQGHRLAAGDLDLGGQVACQQRGGPAPSHVPWFDIYQHRYL